MTLRLPNARAPMLAALLVAGAVSACREARRPPEVRIPPAFAVAESLRLRGRSAEALPHFERLRDSFALAASRLGRRVAEGG